MSGSLGQILFLFTPLGLAALLMWRVPTCRRIPWRSLFMYLLVMSTII